MAEKHPVTGLIETGTAHPATGPLRPNAPTAAGKIVIVTFNIRYGVGSFLISGSLLRRLGVTRPARRAALVEKHLRSAGQALSEGGLMPKADIVALQEADRMTLRAGGHHVARELAEMLETNWAHAGLEISRVEQPKKKQWYLDFEEHIAPDDPGQTGIAILSRFPLVTCARVELPWVECASRPRLALHATVQIGVRRLHIFNSHIDPHADIDEQLAQHEAILQEAESLPRGAPVILLGDFNTLTPVSRRKMRLLLEAHGYQTPMPSGVTTWRAGLVRLHTDWIFARGAQVTRWGVARPLGVSDHWPAWIEIDARSLSIGARQP